MRFLQLLLAILVSILILSMAAFDWLLQLLADVLLLNALLVSLSTETGPFRWRRVLWVLFALSVGCTAVALFMASSPWRPWVFVLGIKFDILLLAACLAAVLGYIFSCRRIDLDHIFAAVVAYILLAVIFAQMYYLLFFYNPQSFNLPLPESTGLALLHGTFLYYSFMIITTVGLGDVVPLTPLARIVTAIEAMSGQFFLAVLVAWLVGRFLAADVNPRPPSP